VSTTLDLTAIHIYDGSFCSSLNISEIADYVQQAVPGASVRLQEEFLQYHIINKHGESLGRDIEALARDFAGIKIIDPQQRKRLTVPLPGEVGYEKRRLINRNNQPAGILYDGERMLELFNQALPKDGRGSRILHLVVTNQLFGTWSPDDLRFHARTSIYGIPCVISTAGLVEAPAKSRQYYFTRQLGVSPDALEQRFQGQFLVYDEPRITSVIKGYIMQALLYHLTGEPFCDDPNCRLFNAHWQHELIHAQLESPYEFCPDHQSFLDRLRSNH